MEKNKSRMQWFYGLNLVLECKPSLFEVKDGVQLGQQCSGHFSHLCPFLPLSTADSSLILIISIPSSPDDRGRATESRAGTRDIYKSLLSQKSSL